MLALCQELADEIAHHRTYCGIGVPFRIHMLAAEPNTAFIGFAVRAGRSERAENRKTGVIIAFVELPWKRRFVGFSAMIHSLTRGG